MTPSAKREAARYLVEQHGLSISGGCRCAGLHRSGYYRAPAHWTVKDAPVIAALAELVEGRPRRGFWKCRKILKRQGYSWNHKRIYRVYKQMELNLRRPAKRRLLKQLRVPLYVPRLPDSVWSADFMSDALACGRRYRTFNVADDFNREAINIGVDTSTTTRSWSSTQCTSNTFFARSRPIRLTSIWASPFTLDWSAPISNLAQLMPWREGVSIPFP